MLSLETTDIVRTRLTCIFVFPVGHGVPTELDEKVASLHLPELFGNASCQGTGACFLDFKKNHGLPLLTV